MKRSSGILQILKTGPGLTIQDQGRLGQQSYGVPISGPADSLSFNWVNHVLQNDPHASVLEVSQPGLQAKFTGKTTIAWAGAQVNVKRNGEPVTDTNLIQIEPNDELEFGRFHTGNRLYIGIKDGFLEEEILGSQSFYKGISVKSSFKPLDELAYNCLQSSPLNHFAKPKWNSDWYKNPWLDFYEGPDFILLSDDQKQKLVNLEFTLSSLSSRMGILLEEKLENNLPELPTNPVFPGFVQLTSGGTLIILGPDAQVTGGYPRIMILSSLAQSILAQKRPGQHIKFRKINLK